MNIKKFFTSLSKSSSPTDPCEIHNTYISFVKDILSFTYPSTTKNPNLLRLNAIDKILRDLALNEQHYILQYAMRDEHDFFYHPIFSQNAPKCPKCGELHNCHATITTPKTPISFDIAHHPTISKPWNRARLINTLSSIGSSVDKPFTFDKLNHFGSTLFPLFNLLLIRNGFHSSTCGIYETKAIYHPEYICDCSSFYNEVYFDGISFRHVPCNHVISTPANKSIGTIYEIGRLILENNLSFLTLLEHEQNTHKF